MNQSNHPHGIEEHEVSTFTDLLREKNPFGITFSFERKTCAHCFKWLGDSSPVFVETISPVSNPTKRIVIQEMVCKSKKYCEEGEQTIFSRNEMSDLGNIIGSYCANCSKMSWKNKNTFSAENLGACKA